MPHKKAKPGRYRHSERKMRPLRLATAGSRRRVLKNFKVIRHDRAKKRIILTVDALMSTEPKSAALKSAALCCLNERPRPKGRGISLCSHASRLDVTQSGFSDAILCFAASGGEYDPERFNQPSFQNKSNFFLFQPYQIY